MSGTCVIKFNVIHHQNDPNLVCVQYFFYWSIQIFPHHFFDYEPIYVYAYLHNNKSDILSVSFNSVPVNKVNLGSFLSQFGKRPGHLIRLFFNDNKAQWSFNDDSKGEGNSETLYFRFEDYNEFADFMTLAYSGQYVYEKIPKNCLENNLSKITNEEGRIILCIPKKVGFPVLHAFGVCSQELVSQKDLILNCDLIPLSSWDLLHIEWNIDRPFQAPFLYPVVGKKNPLMHLPFDFYDFSDINQRSWQRFCRQPWVL